MDVKLTTAYLSGIQAYLLLHNWFEDSKIRDVACVWHRHDNNDAEVILPTPNARDYQLRIHDAFIAIASFEGRNAHEVIKDVFLKHPCGNDDHYWWVDDGWPCPTCAAKGVKQRGRINGIGEEK